jgi:hypothetical protein
VDLVKDDKLDVADKVGSLVQHASQNFRRHLSRQLESTTGVAHNQTASLGVDLHVSREDTDAGRVKGGLEVAELLVGERLDGRGVDCPVVVSSLAKLR